MILFCQEFRSKLASSHQILIWIGMGGVPLSTKRVENKSMKKNTALEFKFHAPTVEIT
jgi:hypothetical protein